MNTTERYQRITSLYFDHQSYWEDILKYFEDKKKNPPPIKARFWTQEPEEIQKKKAEIFFAKRTLEEFASSGKLEQEQREEFANMQSFYVTKTAEIKNYENQILYLYIKKRNVRDRKRIRTLTADFTENKGKPIVDMFIGIHIAIVYYFCVKKTRAWIVCYEGKAKNLPSHQKNVDDLLFAYRRNKSLIKALGD